MIKKLTILFLLCLTGFFSAEAVRGQNCGCTPAGFALGVRDETGKYTKQVRTTFFVFEGDEAEELGAKLKTRGDNLKLTEERGAELEKGLPQIKDVVCPIPLDERLAKTDVFFFPTFGDEKTDATLILLKIEAEGYQTQYFIGHFLGGCNRRVVQTTLRKTESP
ncbi:MAG: hypothetical protein R2747_20250 [Pyrinomonadaceae bacterium]